jgi:hypothetical protein
VRKILLAFALLAFGLGPALADKPSDPDKGGGNDPPKQTGSKQGDQKGGPGPEGNSGP